MGGPDCACGQPLSIVTYPQVECNVLNRLIYGRSDRLPPLVVFLAFLIEPYLSGNRPHARPRFGRISSKPGHLQYACGSVGALMATASSSSTTGRGAG